jgi:beta-alanine degradation protein BauB
VLRKILLLAAAVVQVASLAQAGQNVVFENGLVRATRYTLGPRESAKVSAQRSLLYCLSSGELTARIGGDQERLVCDPDVALWNDGPFWIGHRVGTATEFLVIEVKANQPLKGATAEDDGSRVAPLAYGVMFENEFLRVLRFRDNPGERLPAHSHPGNLLRYSVTPLNAKVIAENGAVSNTVLGAGVAQWFDVAERHSWENVGSASEHAIVIEVK